MGHPRQIADLLSYSIYAGQITVDKWNIYNHPAKHKALISFEDFQKIQKRLTQEAKAPARVDLNKDFPLREILACDCCGQHMTACWSKRRDKHYPYYLCFTKGCDYYRKYIRKEKIEEEFEIILQNLYPSENLFSMCKKMFKQLWEHKIQMRGKDKLAIKDELKKTEDQIDKLLERIINAENQTVITAYEKQIKKLEDEKIVLQEKIANSGANSPDYDKTFRTAFLFLSNPHKLPASGKLENKRTALRLLFTSKLSYDLNEGFRTVPIALPFKALEVLKGGENQMARPRLATDQY